MLEFESLGHGFQSVCARWPHDVAEQHGPPQPGASECKRRRLQGKRRQLLDDIIGNKGTGSPARLKISAPCSTPMLPREDASDLQSHTGLLKSTAPLDVVHGSPVGDVIDHTALMEPPEPPKFGRWSRAEILRHSAKNGFIGLFETKGT